MIGDIHLHSSFSADSEARMEDVVRAAIDAGLPLICFTDHIDLDYPVEDLVFEFDIPDYFAEIGRMQELYGERIRIFSGVELGMQPHLGDRYRALLKEHAFDFVIGSQHLVNGQDPYYPETFEGKPDQEVYRAYFENLLEDVRAFHDFDTLGHLDYVVRYGKRRARGYIYRAYADVIDEILKLLVRWNIALELNTAGLRKRLGFPNPHPDILRRYRELGGTLVTCGADAHQPSAVGYGMKEAEEILKSCGFTHYVYFSRRKPYFVRLT